jgi:NADPH2:quinone reductase
MGQEFFGIVPPFVPGDGAVGRVVAVGDGVSPRWLGRWVVARTGGGSRYAGGGCAELAAAREEDAAEVPDGLDLADAAALLHDGPTALGLVESAGVGPGGWMLVVGAARGRAKLEHVRSLGAAAVVDYADPDWCDLVWRATGEAGVAAVFDGVGGEVGTAAFAALAPGGRFSAHGAPSGDFAAIAPDVAAARGVTVRGIEQTQFAPVVWRRLAEQAMAKAVTGRLRPAIGQIYLLARATEAHAVIEARSALGKTLLAVD